MYMLIVALSRPTNVILDGLTNQPNVMTRNIDYHLIYRLIDSISE